MLKATGVKTTKFFALVGDQPKQVKLLIEAMKKREQEPSNFGLLENLF